MSDEHSQSDRALAPLGSLGSFIRGQGGTKADARSSGAPCVRYGDIYTEHNSIIRDFVSFISTASVHRYSLLQCGDVVFAASGETHEEIGKAAAYCGTSPAYAGGDTIIFRPRNGSDPRFLGYAVNSQGAARFKARHGQGSSVIHIAPAHLRELEISVPPLAEQRRIAEILDTIDEAIRRTEQVIAKLQQMKQGLLHDLLTRGIDDNGELRDRGACTSLVGGRMPDSWTCCSLSAVAEVDRGKFGHRPRNDPDFYGGGIPFIQTGDVAEAAGEILYTYGQTLSKRGAAVSREFPQGTVAITIAANIADTAILGVPMYFPDSVVGAVVRQPNVVRFVEMAIRRAKPRLEARAPQSAQKNINLQDLRPLAIALPPPEEQHRIASVYDAHCTRIEEEQRVVRKLNSLRQGLQRDLLTGSVRVRELEGVRA